MAITRFDQSRYMGTGTEGGRRYWAFDSTGSGGVTPHRIHYSSAPPAVPGDGTWQVGDMCFDDTTATQVGWRCTVAGTPGTWVAIGGSGGGDSISVNGVAVTDADFNDTTPAPPDADHVNVLFQRSGSGPDSVSAYVNGPDVRTLTGLDPLTYGFGYVIPQDAGGASTFRSFVGANLSTVAGTLSYPLPASTNLSTSIKRWRNVTAGAVQSPAEERGTNGTTGQWLWRGNAAGLGGFFAGILSVWYDAINTDSRGFYGLRVSMVGIGSTSYTGQVDWFGFGFRETDTNWQILQNDSAGNITATDLGASFPKASGLYDFYFYTAGNAANMQCRAIRRDSAADSGIQSFSTEIPSSTAFMAPYLHTLNAPAAGTAVAVGYNLRQVLAVWNIGHGVPTFGLF